jgi:hypothetical protein
MPAKDNHQGECTEPDEIAIAPVFVEIDACGDQAATRGIPFSDSITSRSSKEQQRQSILVPAGLSSTQKLLLQMIIPLTHV